MFQQLPHISAPAPRWNIFQAISFKAFQSLPRFLPYASNPAFLSNYMRDMPIIAWHSKYRTVFPHSLDFRMLRAITKNQIHEIKKILDNERFDVNKNIIDKKYGMNSLMFASLINRHNVMQLLLLHGANINKGDPQGNTSLMIAVSHQNLEAINTLMKNGCDRRLKNKYGFTAIDKAKELFGSPHIYNFVKDYPETIRKFPNFKVQLDLNLRHPMWDFIDQYKVYTGKAKLYPFNDFKGNYRVNFTEYKTVGKILQERKLISKEEKQRQHKN